MIVTPSNIVEVVAKLRLSDLLACDTETTGLEETDKAFAVILADHDGSYYFDERTCPRYQLEIEHLFLNKERTFVFQNAKFDLRMLGTLGLFPLGRVEDIASAARIIRNDHFQAGAYSLDAQAQRVLGQRKGADIIKKYIKDHDLHEVRKDFFGVEYKTPRYDKVPVELMATYGVLDGRLTFDIRAKYMTMMSDDDLRVYKNECDLIKVCYRMERVGVHINKQVTMQAMHGEQELGKSYKETFKKITGQDFVNSAKSVQKVLKYELPQTEDGNPSLTDDVIEEIISRGTSDDVEIARTVRYIRMYDKRVSTYYKSYLNFADNQSVIHPFMWIAGTRTGRFSYSDPNLQNIPKEDEDESMGKISVRSCFTPRTGRTFVSFDYSQMEYRMMAAYAGETEIIKAVMGGADFHQATADMLGITRKQAKTVNFAILYGAGDEKLAGMLGINQTDASHIRYKYFSKLPKVERFIDDVIRTGRSRGYVKNWFGRKLYADREFCYALPNHLIQGGGADVVKVAMNQIGSELPQLYMVMQIHDQLVFELTDTEMENIPDVKHIMENVFPEKNGMKLTVDVSYSTKSLAERDMVKYV